MLSTLRQLQASESWDAVVAIQSPAALYALLLPIPRVLDMDTALSYQLHEQFSRTTSPLARIRALVSWQKAHWYEAYLMRRYQAVTAVSDQELDFLRSMVSGTSCQVVLNPNGVDCVHNRPGFVAPQPRTLVYNGALTYSANYDAMQYFLAEVYPAIKAQVPDTTMKITGSTKGVDLAGLRLDDSVRLTGYVEDVRVPVAGSAVCVVPLREGGGTRLKILEAMALGTPVVATSKGAEGLNVTHERDILIADSSSGLVAEVLRLFRDQALCERLSANARRLVEREYDWGLIGGQFARLVESVVEAQRSRLA
jgi:glycosyltransferase involved in cell wall biosynthesis